MFVPLDDISRRTDIPALWTEYLSVLVREVCSVRWERHVTSQLERRMEDSVMSMTKILAKLNHSPHSHRRAA